MAVAVRLRVFSVKFPLFDVEMEGDLIILYSLKVNEDETPSASEMSLMAKEVSLLGKEILFRSLSQHERWWMLDWKETVKIEAPYWRKIDEKRVRAIRMINRARHGEPE